MPIERLNFVSSSSSDILVNEHLLRYRLVKQFVDNKIVLDIACGSGYGANLLAKGAKRVIGVDVDNLVITEAKERYKANNLEFIVSSGLDLSLEDKSIDTVVSLETIEHFSSSDQIKFLKELKRVLKPEGLLLMSTPNSDASKHKNPWHLKELNKVEFKNLLSSEFTEIEIFQQGTALASVITRDNNIEEFKASLDQKVYPKYYIALASNVSLKESLEGKQLKLASLNTLAWGEREKNLGYRAVDAVYYRLSRYKIFRRIFKSLKA